MQSKLTESEKAIGTTKAEGEKALSSLKEEFSKKEDALKAQHQKNLLHKYVECKLQFSGLQIPKASRALLDECSSEQEIEELLSKLREAISEQVLHSSLQGKIVVTEQKTPEQQRIDNSIGAAFSKM